MTSSMYFHSDGIPDMDKLNQLQSEIDTGLWDTYLLWTAEAYDNLSSGTNLTNRFLQMASFQPNPDINVK